MSRIGTALYLSLGILIAFLIFTSMIKMSLFSASWFEPEKTIFPTIFYSALIDFVVLVVLFSFLHNVRLYAGAFNDDVTFLAGIGGLIGGWLVVKFIQVIMAIGNLANSIPKEQIADKPKLENVAVVIITLAVIVVSREIILRGFLFQYLSRGFGYVVPTFAVPLCVALFGGRVEHYSFIEAVNIFLFNVVLCYCFRMFHDLWLSSAFSFAVYLSAFFGRLPIRELSFLNSPNLLTGLERSWFGSEITIFAGLPMTFVLIVLLLIMHSLVKNRKILPLPDALDYPEVEVRRGRAKTFRDQNMWIG